MKRDVLILITALAGSSSGHAANLLTNGSFELPGIVATGVYAIYGSGSTAITGWTVVGADTQLTPDTYLGLPASEGRQWLDLTGIVGYDKGVRSDAVATVIGQTYKLTFALGNYVPFGTSSLSVSINGEPATTFTNLVNGSGPMDWENKSLTWVADAVSAQITFRGVANGALSNNLGIGLDNVGFAAAPVPEPEACVFLIAGLAAAGVSMQRRRQKPV